MKTHSIIHRNVLQRLSRFSKLLFVAGIAVVLAVPQVDARPDCHRGGDRGGYSRHYGHGHGHYHSQYRPVPRPIYRPAPVAVHRGWSRPGFHGAYPPAGYVNYRYVRSLPPGCRTVYRGGSRYHYSNGNYYWPARYQNSGVYLSVRF